MRSIIILLIIGFSGIAAQVILLRELLSAFQGNELTLGIILGNWVISEALGAFFAGRRIDKAKNNAGIFIAAQFLFSIGLIVSLYFCRTFKPFLGLPFGQGSGLGTMFWASFLIILPAGFSRGALFSLCSKIFLSIGNVYSLETIGVIIGGFGLTYFLIPALNSFEIAFLIILLNMFICLFFYKGLPKPLSAGIILLAALITLLFQAGLPAYLHNFSLKQQWQAGKLLSYVNSPYGNLVAIEKEGQTAFYYNALPIIIAPQPDTGFIEEYGNLPLLFQEQPKKILLLNAGAGGLINEALKHAPERIDYAELDPALIRMIKEFPSELIKNELSDKRVRVINTDGRSFLRQVDEGYDVIIIGSSSPGDLQTNRYFSQEFFSLAKQKLNPQGLLALWLPGSLAYIGEEVRDINYSVINALDAVFKHTRLIPGDFNIVLATDAKGLSEITPQLLSQRLAERRIRTNLLLPAYLEYRLDKKWLEWFNASSLNHTKEINRDLRPRAVFEMLLYWNKQFSPLAAKVLKVMGKIDIKNIALIIFAFSLISFAIFKRVVGAREKGNKGTVSIFQSSPGRKIETVPLLLYAIATTGFFGMLINLALVFSFQVFYGYIYQMIGVLISLFMAGVAVASLALTRKIEKIKNPLVVFIGLEAGIGVFALFLGLFIPYYGKTAQPSTLVFSALFLISGAFLGAEFPLAARLISNNKKEIGKTAGELYAADLLGGWLAGMLTGIILLPVLGLFNTCLIVVMLKTSSLALFRLILDKKAKLV